MELQEDQGREETSSCSANGEQSFWMRAKSELSQEQVFTVLQSSRRRYLLTYL